MNLHSKLREDFPLEVERDPNPREMQIYLVAGLTLGTFAYLLAGVWAALATLIVVAGEVHIVFDMLAKRQISPTIREGATRAVAVFRQTYPNDELKSVALRAIETNRFVYSLRYGIGRPGPRRYFGVAKTGGDVVEISAGSRYWPRGLK